MTTVENTAGRTAGRVDVASSHSHNRRRIAANFLGIAGSSGLGLIVTVLISIYVRRALGPVAIGEVSWNLAVLAFLGLIANPGLQVIGQREVANSSDDASSLVSLILSLQVLFALIAYGIVIAIAALGLREPEVGTLLLIQGTSLFLTAWNPGWILQAHERMVAPAVAALIFNILQFPALVILVHGPSDVYLYVVCGLPPFLLSALYNFWYLARCGVLRPGRLKWSLRGAGACLAAAWPVALTQVAILVFYNCGAIILGFTHGDAAVGQYATAFRLMQVANVLPMALWNAYLPALARARDDPPQAIKISRELMGLLTWLGFPIAALGWAFGRDVVEFMYGPAFQEASVYFEWMCLAVALIFLNYGIGTVLFAWGFQKLLFKITGSVAVLSLPMNLVLIPLYGAWGAIAATMATEAAILVLSIIVRRRIGVGWHPLLSIAAPPALCSAVVALGAYMLAIPQSRFWWIECAIAVFALGGCLIGFERRAVLSAVRHLRR